MLGTAKPAPADMGLNTDNKQVNRNRSIVTSATMHFIGMPRTASVAI
jgi:hypothetical protein